MVGSKKSFEKKSNEISLKLEYYIRMHFDIRFAKTAALVERIKQKRSRMVFQFAKFIRSLVDVLQDFTAIMNKEFLPQLC